MSVAGITGSTSLTPRVTPPGQERSAPVAGVVGETKKSPDGQELTPEQQREVQRLEARDREVRQHERAHQAAGGQHVRGGPSYEKEKGPDGKMYAVGGEVQIDTSPVQDNPSATIEKMKQVQRAALAPADPSAADRKVAADAARKLQQARREQMLEDKADLESPRATGSDHQADPRGSAAGRYSQAAGSYADASPARALNRII